MTTATPFGLFQTSARSVVILIVSANAAALEPSSSSNARPNLVIKGIRMRVIYSTGRGRELIQTFRKIVPGTVADSAPLRPGGVPRYAK